MLNKIAVTYHKKNYATFQATKCYKIVNKINYIKDTYKLVFYLIFMLIFKGEPCNHTYDRNI